MTISLLKRKSEKLVLLTIMLLSSIAAFAQDSISITETTTTSTTTEEWMANPLYWVIGALLLIVLIAFIVRSNSRKD